jgi:hypothetical protein
MNDDFCRDLETTVAECARVAQLAYRAFCRRT